MVFFLLFSTSFSFHYVFFSFFLFPLCFSSYLSLFFYFLSSFFFYFISSLSFSSFLSLFLFLFFDFLSSLSFSSFLLSDIYGWGSSIPESHGSKLRDLIWHNFCSKMRLRIVCCTRMMRSNCSRFTEPGRDWLIIGRLEGNKHRLDHHEKVRYTIMILI